MATPTDAEASPNPAPDGPQRISYLDADGQPASRDTAQFAVIRDVDDKGNVLSIMTERLS